MSNLSAIVLTYNSSGTLEKCLESIKWITDIVIVDSGSTDRTNEIAKTYTARIYYNKYVNYGRQLNWVLKKIASEWILVVDSDEAVTAELSKNIENLIKNRHTLNGYYIPRRNYFLGKPVNYCGWYPDYVLRLFQREGAVYKDRELGSSVELKGEKGYLCGDLIHQPYRNLEHYFQKFNKYTDLAAKEILKKKRKIGIFHLVLWPFVKFFKMYILKRGFLDGAVGIVVCVLGAFYVFSKYAKALEKGTKAQRHKGKAKLEIDSVGIKKIVIRSVNWIGDAVMTTPAITQLAKNFPDAKITIVVKEWVKDVFIGNPFIDDIIVCNPKNLVGYIRLIRKLRKERFDIGIAFPNSF
ncbi:glycosyltransferase, partial [bacterium]|nr:glycosyltransferase [bacterium]